MCLSTRHTKKEMDKWLKTQPDIITAYKIVEKKRNNDKKYKLVPLYCSGNTKEYKKKNRIRGDRPFVKPAYYNSSRRPYKAYFHLWIGMPEMPKYYDKYGNIISVVIIKCHVPKHLITAIGTDSEIPTIVSKGFDIIDYYGEN